MEEHGAGEREEGRTIWSEDRRDKVYKCSLLSKARITTSYNNRSSINIYTIDG
jgi:hypothetical protein